MCDINHWSWHDFFKVTIDPAPVWRVTYKWVMSQSCHICKWVMSHMNEACQIWIRWMKESFHTWRSHVTHTDAFICSRSTHMNQSCHTNKPTMLHIWMRHITQALIDISYQPRACVMWRQSGPVLCDVNQGLCYVTSIRACVMWPVLCDDISIRACVMWPHVTYEWPVLSEALIDISYQPKPSTLQHTSPLSCYTLVCGWYDNRNPKPPAFMVYGLWFKDLVFLTI